MPPSPGCRCRTVSTLPRPARSSTPSSGRAARSRPVRVRVSRRSRRAPSSRRRSPGRTTSPPSSRRSPSRRDCCSCVLAVFKMGWIAQFLSRAVVTGFLFGAAIDVVIGELPKLTGTEVTGSNPIQELRSWFGSLGDANRATVLVGAVSLVVVFGLRASPRASLAPWSSWWGSPRVADLRSRRARRRAGGRRAEGAADAGAPRVAAGGRSRGHDRARRRGAGAHRLLADCRRLPDLRGQAPLSHRHQPGIRRPGHVQRGRRPVPGDARLDEPVGEFAQRPLGRAQRPRLRSLPVSSSCSRCSSWRRSSRTCPRRARGRHHRGRRHGR